ncbi:putative basic-leucine zipper transcription factor N [Dissostichus eleginoides]|uniref:Basic-leucine zipper transcription factor N n=1 Tax=Dissostichus eleginoides TaxID=100907 RepID=A0AAD9FI24_DISEL|nr:putative basic-leucine zipper transcription factor N [Dissostichus eleginoides]
MAKTSKEKTACYRQRVNADPTVRADYLARKRESYHRRKQQGKIPYLKLDEISEREKKKRRDKWNAASRGYRGRKKMEKAMLDLTPPSMENTPPVLAGVEVIQEQQENPGQAVVDPLPHEEGF